MSGPRSRLRGGRGQGEKSIDEQPNKICKASTEKPGKPKTPKEGNFLFLRYPRPLKHQEPQKSASKRLAYFATKRFEAARKSNTGGLKGKGGFKKEKNRRWELGAGEGKGPASGRQTATQFHSPAH